MGLIWGVVCGVWGGKLIVEVYVILKKFLNLGFLFLKLGLSFVLEVVDEVWDVFEFDFG